MSADRRRVLDELDAIRRTRSAFLVEIGAGADVGAAVERAVNDSLAARTWVGAAVRAVPGMGKVAANRLLDELGIDPQTSVGDLDPAIRRVLIDSVVTRRSLTA